MLTFRMIELSDRELINSYLKKKRIEHTVFPISLPLVTFQVLTTQTYHFSYHFESRFCDILRYFTRFSL